MGHSYLCGDNTAIGDPVCGGLTLQ
jgi:hypothetical protein